MTVTIEKVLGDYIISTSDLQQGMLNGDRQVVTDIDEVVPALYTRFREYMPSWAKRLQDGEPVCEN
jgi:hypothetical protein